MIYILLPVHNRINITKNYVNCLLRQTCKDFHLILIDDGSDDGTSDAVCALMKGHLLTIIRGLGNWWWAGSLQQGYKWLHEKGIKQNDVVFISNDDIEFDINFLQQAIDILNQNRKSLLSAEGFERSLGSKIDGGIYINWKDLRFEIAKSPDKVNCLSTRALFMRAEDFIHMKDFPHKFLPHYFSDYEFTIRAKRIMHLQLIASQHLKFYSVECMIKIKDNSLGSFKGSLEWLFSLKNPGNPVYYSVFLILSCPFQYLFLNLFRVWKRSLMSLFIK